ncbi:MAG: phytoene/squalene synthase family protein, partial [Myxococcales bacterium]|nr:phytoene/squalene synthase family protein [Myxococcales bacterium]
MSAALVLRRDDRLACRAWIQRHSKSFFLSSLLLPPRVRQASWALYAFCRRADDAVDEQSAGGMARVESLRARLERVYAGRADDDAIDRAFGAVVERHAIPRALPEALLAGMEMDARGTGYANDDELLVYCFRVAATVGLMMTRVMGASDDVAYLRAADLGVAMQLTNIARDVGEDERRGRVYLPASLLDGVGGDRRAAVRALLLRAEAHYRAHRRARARLRRAHLLRHRARRRTRPRRARRLRRRARRRRALARLRRLSRATGAACRHLRSAPHRLRPSRVEHQPRRAASVGRFGAVYAGRAGCARPARVRPRHLPLAWRRHLSGAARARLRRRRRAAARRLARARTSGWRDALRSSRARRLSRRRRRRLRLADAGFGRRDAHARRAPPRRRHGRLQPARGVRSRLPHRRRRPRRSRDRRRAARRRCARRRDSRDHRRHRGRSPAHLGRLPRAGGTIHDVSLLLHGAAASAAAAAARALRALLRHARALQARRCDARQADLRLHPGLLAPPSDAGGARSRA